MMPEDFTWADTIGADAVMGDNKKAKNKKDKSRQQRGSVMSYDASLVCYFNPTEYAAAMNMGLYTGPPAEETANGTDSKNKVPTIEPVNPVEEAIIAKRRIATLLDDVKPDTLHTYSARNYWPALRPRNIEPVTELCTGMSERTPEFKDGAKTINFRRILLTKCYESLIEEPDSQPLHLSNKKGSSNGQNGALQHSWRRKCMLQNVGFVGELFRRQLLTENIMHVCVAMMLDDEVKPQAEIIEAACGLLNLVGDLLDGSSPASRRTMDEYFAVLVRIQENCPLPDRVKKLIADTVRVGGWIKNRQENASASSTPAASPAKATDAESNGTAESPVSDTDPVSNPATAAKIHTVLAPLPHHHPRLLYPPPLHAECTHPAPQHQARSPGTCTTDEAAVGLAAGTPPLVREEPLEALDQQHRRLLSHHVQRAQEVLQLRVAAEVSLQTHQEEKYNN
ncbi:hypothetical protein ON010_g6864 [Phytophthora cinnamomi]|nr:hypothetical protein ON010_g6864 [Phytophthora cinnamomi]